jgi:hypothetical protein
MKVSLKIGAWVKQLLLASEVELLPKMSGITSLNHRRKLAITCQQTGAEISRSQIRITGKSPQLNNFSPRSSA